MAPTTRIARLYIIHRVEQLGVHSVLDKGRSTKASVKGIEITEALDDGVHSFPQYGHVSRRDRRMVASAIDQSGSL